MRVMVVGIDEGDVRIRYVPNELETLQTLVGGHIETAAPVQLREHGIEILVDEEGLLKGKHPNLNLFPFFLVGPVMFVGVSESEFVSLSAEQIRYIRTWLMSLSMVD